MAVTLTAATAEVEVDTAVAITGAGLTAATAYNLTITRPSSGITVVVVTTDGSGGFTYQFVPNSPGTVSFSLAPAAPVVVATLTLTSVA